MKDNWIKVENKLPPIGIPLLICIDDTLISFGRYGAFHKDTERQFYDDIEDRKVILTWGENVKVTHWQLLQKP